MRGVQQVRVAAAVAAVVVFGAACGSSDTDSETATTTAAAVTTTTSAATPTTVSVATLTERLLAAGDLPAGWKLGHAVNNSDFEAFAQLPCDNAAINPLAAKRLTAQTGIQFEPTGGSSAHLIELVTTGEPAQLTKDIGMLIGAREDACSASDATSGGSPISITSLTLPSVGDQRSAYSGRVDSSAHWFGRNAVVRVGSVAVVVGLTEVLSSATATPMVCDAEFVQLVERAVQRLQG
jgi:hypothetical protein